MGAFRLILSLLVVGSHVGGMGDTQAGGTAVACFFAISGFLMARTIAENYRGNGFLRFYLNRLIRLTPPLLVVVLLTAGLLWVRDSRGFEIEQGSGELYMPVEFPSSLRTLIEHNPAGFPNFVKMQFHLVPQAWSLLVEGGFYLIAPLIVLLVERRLNVVVWALAAVSFLLAVESARLHLDWMRSPFTTVWMFLLGMQTYFLARTSASSKGLGTHARRWAVVPLVIVVAIAMPEVSSLTDVAFMVAPWLVVTWLALGQWHARQGDRVDQTLGNLAYGVFLGHFLGTLSMYWIAETVHRGTGVFGIFGGPNDSRLLVWSYAFALAVGAAIFYAVERPLDKVRARVRRRSSSVARARSEVVVAATAESRTAPRG